MVPKGAASIYDVRSGVGGRGSPKSRQKEQNQLISVCKMGREGVKKSEIFADNGSPLTACHFVATGTKLLVMLAN